MKISRRGFDIRWIHINRASYQTGIVSERLIKYPATARYLKFNYGDNLSKLLEVL
jgi:hypothetical protein